MRPFLLAALSAFGLVLAMGSWRSTHMLGFPDGHLTAYDQAVWCLRMAGALIGVALAGAGASVAIRGRPEGWRPVGLLALGYLLLVGTLLGADALLYSLLEHGQGG